jgi:glycosyltransferase involved in cell wall biosynthesis
MFAEIASAETKAAIAPSGTLPGRIQRPRLLVMAHFVYTTMVGGAEHGFYNTIRGIGDRGVQVGVICGARARFDPDVLAEIEALPEVRVIEAGGTTIRFLAEQLACLRSDLRADAILFPNYYVPPYVPRRLGRVTVVIHDRIHWYYPQYSPTRRRAWLELSHAWAVRRADTVIVISRFVADDVARVFGSSVGRKLAVIPNPVSWDRFGPPGDATPIDRPYILSVAAHYPHKNLDTLLKAFVVLAKRNRDVMLVLCGQNYSALRGTTGGAGILNQLVAALGIPDRVIMTGHVTDAALGRWYRHAAVFAFPSVFEGFGSPPVEALGFQLPTLTTRCTAIPEATLGLAHYVDDPYSIEEWATRLEAMLRDPAAARPTQADAARVRANYSPERLGPLYLSACGASDNG